MDWKVDVYGLLIIIIELYTWINETKKCTLSADFWGQCVVSCMLLFCQATLDSLSKIHEMNGTFTKRIFLFDYFEIIISRKEFGGYVENISIFPPTDPMTQWSGQFCICLFWFLLPHSENWTSILLCNPFKLSSLKTTDN